MTLSLLHDWNMRYASLWEVLTQCIVFLFGALLLLPWTKIKAAVIWWPLYISLCVGGIVYGIIMLGMTMELILQHLHYKYMNDNGISFLIGTIALTFLTAIAILQPIVIWKLRNRG